MKNYLVLLVTVLLLITGVPASADTLYSRLDVSEGKEGSLTLAYWGTVDLYVFGANKESKDIEVGKMWPVLKKNGHTVLAGAYLAYVTGPEEFHILPWVIVTGPALGGTYKAALADYIPLNGGSHYLFSTESSLMWGKGAVKYGVAGNLGMPEGGTFSTGIGPKASLTHGAWTASLRVLSDTRSGTISARATLDYRF